MTRQRPGTLVVSLDFELFWGVRDRVSMETFTATARGARRAVGRMLSLFARYQIHATWATVGFLFFQNRAELLQGLPACRPQYEDGNLSPYNHLHRLGTGESDDPLHFGASLLETIKTYPYQEVASHTFSHYYCLEKGQTLENFRQDIVAAQEIASRRGVTLHSIVFPRNQVNRDYLPLLKELKIAAYRGNNLAAPPSGGSQASPSTLKRGYRLLDSYLNLSGHNAYACEAIKDGPPFNIPASRFLRPYSSAFSMLEPLRAKRICASLTAAAQQGLIYHLWWHPHNFANNQEKNLHFLEKLFDHYNTLKQRYGMQSCNMHELTTTLGPG